MPAKCIMIQGTMSNSGKSFVTAGICRVLRQDGFRVAPFKSQNMALNSYITEGGLEMGRAQVMQAEAAGIKPDVRMNPVLLKPTSHTGSQVVIMGEVEGNMSAMHYYAGKDRLRPLIQKAYDSLAEEFDVIVIEGAGSPAEINLKDNDIVNMGMARMADAPVLLVGDIDRGGVFASLYGTIALLEPEEQERIKGLIINKFRGDVQILKPGLGLLEEKTGKSVVGVIPMEQIDIDDEDSLSERLHVRKSTGGLDIAVIQLPHISNFTDFNRLEQIEGASVRYSNRTADMGEPDLLILPGSKNTMGDMQWLTESGMAETILKLAEQGIQIIGICGGFQLLGESLLDPDHVEYGGTMRGLGLLHAETVFLKDKTRTQITGKINSNEGILADCQGHEVIGYEIHMGVTKNLGQCKEILRLSDGRSDGLMNSEGTVFGTYLHGFFDAGDVAVKLLSGLAAKKGITLVDKRTDYIAYREEQYDKLADLIRASLYMEEIYRIMGLKRQ